MSMSEESKANLAKLKTKLLAMQVELMNISDSAFQDMEGADEPDFSISSTLSAGAMVAGRNIKTMLAEVERLEAGGNPQGE